MTTFDEYDEEDIGMEEYDIEFLEQLQIDLGRAADILAEYDCGETAQDAVELVESIEGILEDER